jgi:hypothetical protein
MVEQHPIGAGVLDRRFYTKAPATRNGRKSKRYVWGDACVMHAATDESDISENPCNQDRKRLHDRSAGCRDAAPMDALRGLDRCPHELSGSFVSSSDLSENPRPPFRRRAARDVLPTAWQEP